MFVEGVFIGKGNGGLLVQLADEVYVEIDDLTLEEIGNRVGVGNDAFHKVFVEI